MAFRMSNDLKNLIVNTIVPVIAGTTGTAGTGELKIYSGNQPANADTSGTGATLCTISNIGWETATSGTSSFSSTSGYTGTAGQDGTAGWARLELIGEAGTYRIDGDIGTSVANVFTINVNNFSSGGIISLLSADIYCA